MKKLLRSVAVLLAAAAVACFCSMSAFAEAADDTMTDAELQELLEMLESQGTVASGTDVSGTDISGSDVIGTTARSFGDYEMVEQNIKEYGVRFDTPALEQSGTVYSSAEELGVIFGDTVSANALFDISYSGFTNYIYYGTTDDGASMMALTYTESNWSHFLGSYADMSTEAQIRLEQGSDLIGVGDGSTAKFRIINGTPMLCQEYYDTTYLSKYYIVQTVVSGGMYELYIQLSAPTEADMDVAEKVISSLKISGFDTHHYGVAGTCVTGWLIALVVILFIAVALLAFFIIRFSLFAKASGSSFNIIGFDLPCSSDEDYDDDDEEDEEDED